MSLTEPMRTKAHPTAFRLSISWHNLLLWLTIITLAAALAASVYLAARWVVDHRDNGFIASLASGHDLAVSTEDPELLLFARLNFLLVRDRLDEAQPLLNQIVHGNDKRLAFAALYNMANARMRVAFEHLESGRIDPAIPLVRLTKEGYRKALTLDPSAWDAKYNLDIAMRLIRDFPQFEQSGEEVPPEAVKRLWTELPGLPKGLP